MASKPEPSEPDSIPVLTDVIKTGINRTAVKPVDRDPQEPALFPASEDTFTKIDRNELEQLIYKTLHQNLPQLCQQLADSIIAGLNPDTKAEPPKAGKSRPRR